MNLINITVTVRLTVNITVIVRLTVVIAIRDHGPPYTG